MRRNFERSLLLAALWLVALWLVGSTPAMACSCLYNGKHSGFLDPEGQELPANAAGLVWRGEIPKPADEFFSITEITADGLVDHEVVVRLISDPPGDRWENLFVIAPASGFEPGSFYRFHHGRPWHGGERGSLVVRVAALELEASQELILRAGEPRTAEVQFAAAVMCSASQVARTVDVKLELPEELQRFSNSLFYSTRVGNEPWTPADHMCSVNETGAGWRGRARDELFLPCGRLHVGLRNDDFFRETGRYEVEMVVWLPGRFEVGRGRAVVELDCDTGDAGT